MASTQVLNITEHVWLWEKVEEVLRGPWVSTAPQMPGVNSSHHPHCASYSARKPLSKNSLEDMVYNISHHMLGSQKSLVEPSMARAREPFSEPPRLSTLPGEGSSTRLLGQRLQCQSWGGHQSASSAPPAGSSGDALLRRSLPKCPVLKCSATWLF